MDFHIDDASRLSHAYILSSPDRAECLNLAGQIAAAAVCERERNVPCGACRACRKAQNGVHPDIIRIRREANRSFITVEQIRAMTADAYVLPNESARKVYLVEEADKLNAAGQNAALKTLEEPPAGVIFLLCTENAALLLPTVRSRCVELAANAEADGESEESRRRAQDWLRLAEAGDESALLRWCFAQEGLTREEAAAFFESAQALLLARLPSQDRDGAAGRARFWTLLALLDRCARYLQSNVGIKHIFGLLAAESAAGDRK